VLLAAEDNLATLGEYHQGYHWCRLTDTAFEGVVEELSQTQRNGHAMLVVSLKILETSSFTCLMSFERIAYV
jgi:hypothetical protein